MIEWASMETGDFDIGGLRGLLTVLEARSGGAPSGDLDRALRRLVGAADAVRAVLDGRPDPIANSDAVRMRGLLSDAIGCVSEGFVLFDEEGRLALCNERYRAAYPLLADHLTPGVRFADLLRLAVERGAAGDRVADPAAWIEERLKRHIENQQPSDHRLGDGRWYRISEHPTSSGGIVKILTDITEMKRHEEALAESEERYRRLVEVAPYGIVVWDATRVRFANRAAEAILGCADPAAMAGAAVVDRSDMGGTTPLMDALPAPGGPAPAEQPLEARVQHADGTVRDLEVGVHPFQVDGAPAWFLVFLDVTQRKQAERAVHQSHKMQAIGQLAGGIAHEFNNMLTAIGGFAMMARRTPNDRARVTQCLTEIVKATERAAGLTGQLLSFGRIGRPESAKPVRVSAMLDDLSRFLRPVLGERHPLVLKVKAPGALVVMEPAQLHQALVNLVINGRDAMPGGGPIVVTVDAASLDGAFRANHGDLPDGPYVALEVRDTGTGIEPDALDRIFEPFFTTKEPGQGTGLGLSLVYSTVTRAGGAVEVTSAIGEGSAFTLYLPLAGTGAEEVAVPDPGEDPLGLDEPEGLSIAASVLLVEDEEQVREFIRMTLEDMGMRVVCAADGPEALAAFAEHGGAFDLLVTDLVMPKMNGAVVARTLRRESPDLPVIMISGYPPQNETLEDLLADSDRVALLGKPVNPDDLAEKVHALVV